MLYADTHAHSAVGWTKFIFWNNPLIVLHATGLINCDLFVSLQKSEALQHFMDQYGECFSKSWKSTTYTYLI